VEGLTHLPEQRSLVERLFDQVDSWFKDPLCAEQAFGVTGHVEDRDVPLESADLLGDFPALHSGHDHVGEQQVDMVLVAFRGADRLEAVARRDHLVAVTGKDATGHFTQRRFVFDQEHQLAAAALAAVRRLFFSCRGLVGNRQQDGDGGPDSGFGVDPHVPAGLRDDAVDDGQAQARPLALGLGGEERLERMVGDLRRHPRAVVADLHSRVTARRQVGVRGRVRLVYVDVAGLDDQPAASGHGVAGVDGQVDQDLLDMTLVSQDVSQVGGEAGDQLDVLAERPLQQLEDVGDRYVEVQHARLHHLAAGEGQELMRQPGGPVGGELDLLDIGPGGAPVEPVAVRLLQLLGDEVRVVGDDREQVVEVIRDAAGELTEAFQPLRLM
jgi:hypothetical protein